MLDAAASGPLSNEQIRALTGLDTAGARAVAKHLVTLGELVTTDQKRGTLSQLPWLETVRGHDHFALGVFDLLTIAERRLASARSRPRIHPRFPSFC